MVIHLPTQRYLSSRLILKGRSPLMVLPTMMAGSIGLLLGVVIASIIGWI